MQIFISYKHHEIDGKIAEELYGIIQSWGHKPWIDYMDIPYASTRNNPGFKDEIRKGLEESSVVIGLLSDESLDSYFVQLEWGWARDNDVPIILIKLRDYDKKKLLEFSQQNYADWRQKDIILPKLKNELDEISQKSKRPLVKSYEPNSADYTEPRQYVRERQILDSKHSSPNVTVALIDKIGERIKSKLGDKECSTKKMTNLSTEQAKDILCCHLHKTWLVDILRHDLSETGADIRPNLYLKKGNKRIIQHDHLAIYNEFKGRFLITGEPGLGKTIFLLQLATFLLKAYLDNPKRRIPVIFNLSGWGNIDFKDTSLEDWFALQFSKEYGMPWADVGKENFIFLLDGFDEIDKDVLSDRLEKINKYCRDNPDDNVVICARRRRYPKPQMINKSNPNDTSPKQYVHFEFSEQRVVLQDLFDSEVRQYTNQSTRIAQILESNRESDKTLQELLKIPLFFTMINQLAEGDRLDNGDRNRHEWIHYILSQYMAFDRMMDHKPIKDKGRQKKALNVLGDLTKKSYLYGVIFNINKMTPKWFENYLNFYNTFFFILICVLPVLVWLTLGIGLSGIWGGILGFITLLFTGIIWYRFRFRQLFYHNNISILPKFMDVVSHLDIIEKGIFVLAIFILALLLWLYVRYNAFILWGGMIVGVLPLIILITLLLWATPLVSVPRLSRIKATGWIALAIGASSGLNMIFGSILWFFAIPILLFLLAGGARIIQLRLFYLFFRVVNGVRYDKLMKDLVTRKVFRELGTGYTYRHDYFFRLNWQDEEPEIINHRKQDEKYRKIYQDLLQLVAKKANYREIDKKVQAISQLGKFVIPKLIDTLIVRTENSHDMYFIARILSSFGEDASRMLLYHNKIFSKDILKGEQGARDFDALHHVILVWQKTEFLESKRLLIEILDLFYRETDEYHDLFDTDTIGIITARTLGIIGASYDDDIIHDKLTTLRNEPAKSKAIEQVVDDVLNEWN